MPPANQSNHADWAKVDRLPLPTSLSVLAVQANNTGGPAGIIASDSAHLVWTNSSWRCTNVSESGWMNVGFNDSAWSCANEVGKYGFGPWGKTVSGLNTTASWIWTNGVNSDDTPFYWTIYCRITLGMLRGVNLKTITRYNAGRC